MDLTNLVSLGEASLRLGLTADSLRRRIQAGTISGRLLAGRYYVTNDEVERLATAAAFPAPLDPDDLHGGTE